jgi:outer membrane protein OmpA-like peptidoglycan-associated protein
MFEQKSYLGIAVAQNRDSTPDKRSNNGGSLLKALLFAAITAMVALVLVERFPERLGKVEAKAFSLTASLRGDSGTPEDTHDPAVPEDSHIPSSANVAPGSMPPRKAASPDPEDVIIRNFPTASGSGNGAPGTQQLLNSIFFEQDSAVIRWQYRSSLQHIADALAQNPQANVVLEGHTDSTGPEAYNLDLSGRRAIAVQNSLVNELHVPRERLTAIGAGSTAPVQPNSSPTGRAYNRRVEARLVPADIR